MIKQDGGERVAAAKAEETREPLELLALVRQRVRLLVGHHLQPVLDLAQESIRFAEIACRLAADPAALGQILQRDQRLPATQFRMASSGDELLGLDEEPDLANATAPELDVVTLDRDFVMALVGGHLALHGMHVGDRAIVKILAPHEGRDLAQKGFAKRKIARTGTGLDHGGALPVLPGAF